MIKYVTAEVVLSEIPDEITLAFNISNCPNFCVGCHSKYLKENIGEELTLDIVLSYLNKNDGVTCISFMGGDSDTETLSDLARKIKAIAPNIKIAWYSGRTYTDIDVINPIMDRVKLPVDNRWFDYIKLGPFVQEMGPINSPSTNQRMFLNTGLSSCSSRMIGWIDITDKFWR